MLPGDGNHLGQFPTTNGEEDGGMAWPQADEI